MLKKTTIDLLNLNDINFKNVFSICIGKTYLFQKRFTLYIGKYNYWDTDVEEGILKLDDRLLNVEYIGTTSASDNLWYSSELEKVIPDKYVNLMIKIRNNMQSINLNSLVEGKIKLDGDINGYNLSMIYIAFSPENVAYFCGSGNPSIYMFVKNLPENIFKKINSQEFLSCVNDITSKFNVNHKLMVKALLNENEIRYNEIQNDIKAKFNETSDLIIKFDDNGLITNIFGTLSN